MCDERHRDLRLYLVCTPAGMPILWALADPKPGEREVLAAILEAEADVLAGHDGILLITDKGFAGRDFAQLLASYPITLLRPSRADEQARYGEPMLRKVRQLISRSATPSRASSTSKATAGAAAQASPSASPSGSWPWPLPSGATTTPARRSPDP